jgi:hypothetical protein
MISVNKIQENNPHVHIFSCEDPRFRLFGKIIKNIDFTDAIEYAKKNCKPGDEVSYKGSIDDLEKLDIKKDIENNFYGEMPCQIGWCIGKNNKMNAMEWHRGSELIMAVTDLMLILGKIYDIADNTYNSTLAEACFVPAGTALELYSTTMHFAPINVTAEGFISLITLPKETNTPLKEKTSKDPCLFQKNKWIIAHKSSKPAANGAHMGIIGDNVSLNFAGLF